MLKFKPKSCVECRQVFEPSWSNSRYCSAACSLLAKIVVASPTGCWEWQSGSSQEYGHLTWKGVSKRAHRVAYEIWRGHVPEGVSVLHQCDNPPCCNPTHLFLGTHQDNVDDKVRKSRHTFGERHPRSKLSDADILAIRASGATQTALAEIYGVSQSVISGIQAGTRWAHVK